MNRLLFLLVLTCTGQATFAQYVYTIKADSVKITNSCDTAELIIENHTQTVPGFLYNKGGGRTEFRKGAVKLNDSMYVIGADTLRTRFAPVALNGLSVKNGNVVLGQDVGQTGNPATLISNREIPMNGYSLNFTGIDNATTFKTDGTSGIQIIFNKALSTGSQFTFPVNSRSTSEISDGQIAGANSNYFRELLAIQGAVNLAPNSAAIGNGLAFFQKGFRRSATPTAPSVVTSGAVPTLAVPSIYSAVAIQYSGDIALKGYYSNINTALRFDDPGVKSIENFIDLNVGLYYIANATPVVSNRYGLYINPIKQSYVTHAYGVYQAGASDTNYFNGNTGYGVNPSARVQIAAGTATVGTAPLKLTAGTVLSTPEDGAVEFDGTDLFLTENSTRYKLSKILAGQLTTGFGSPSLSAYNSITTTLSVAGAQPGDVVNVSANTGAVNPASIIITAYVTSTNTVTLQAYNASNSAITIASDTYKVRVIK
jgi:hypothetical protein